MFLFEKATSLGEPTSLGRACVSPLLVMLLATSRSQWTKLGLNRSSVGRGAPKRTLSTPSTPEKPAPPTTRASLISSYQECLNEVKCVFSHSAVLWVLSAVFSPGRSVHMDRKPVIESERTFGFCFLRYTADFRFDLGGWIILITSVVGICRHRRE